MEGIKQELDYSVRSGGYRGCVQETQADIEFRTTLATHIVTTVRQARLLYQFLEMGDWEGDEKTTRAIAGLLDDQVTTAWKPYMAYMMLRYGIDVNLHFHPEGTLQEIHAAVARSEAKEVPAEVWEPLAKEGTTHLLELAERMDVPLPDGFEQAG